MTVMMVCNNTCGQSRNYFKQLNREALLEKVNQQILRKNNVRLETMYTIRMDSLDTTLIKMRVRTFDRKGRLIQLLSNYEMKTFRYDHDHLEEEQHFDADQNNIATIKYSYQNNQISQRTESIPNGAMGMVTYEYDSKGRIYKTKFAGTLYENNQTEVIEYLPNGAKKKASILSNMGDSIDVFKYEYHTLADGSDSVCVKNKAAEVLHSFYYRYDNAGICISESRQSSFIRTGLKYDKNGNITELTIWQKKGNEWLIQGNTEFIRNFQGLLMREYYSQRRSLDIGAEYEYEKYTN